MEIWDNGVGFDVDWALMDAARRGRIGLLGMIERVRMLGGSCDIRSNVGVGTSVVVTIARWVPAVAQPSRSALSA